MYRLPFTSLNRWTSDRKTNLLDNSHVVELAIPGLLEPASINVSLTSHDKNMYAVITGEFVDENECQDGLYTIATQKLTKFEKFVQVPLATENHAPIATLTVAKDTCRNTTEGVLRLEWKLMSDVQIPVEIKDC